MTGPFIGNMTALRELFTYNDGEVSGGREAEKLELNKKKNII
jgi:hypothetical protein